MLSSVISAAAAAAKSLQSCPALCNSIDGSPPGSPVPGILQARILDPFPSPMYESEKWKWSRSVMSDSSRPHGLQPTRLLHPWDFPGKSTGVGCHCLLRLVIYISYQMLNWNFPSWSKKLSGKAMFLGRLTLWQNEALIVLLRVE